MIELKKNRRLKFTVLFMFIAAVLIMPVSARSARSVSDFRDVSPGDWYYDSVKRLYEDGIINGVSAYSYAPEAEVRTSEVAALIVRYLGNGHLAERSRRSKINSNMEGADLWYSGYVQIMIDMGIFDAGDVNRYALRLESTGAAHIPHAAAAALEAPVKRTDMVKFIARSFEIEWWRVNSSGMLPSEISGKGHEFINGGGYDNATLERIAPMITDYNDIPEEYRRFFLKCYYNGIVRGNTGGEVLPHDNLRRSELARIIASVMYFDMRSPDIRSLPPECIITPNDYAVSSVDGSRLLKQEKAADILREIARFTSVSDAGNAVHINIVRHNIIPKGFLAEAYIYMYADGGGIWEVGRVNAASGANAYFPKENWFSIDKAGKTGSANAGYIYFVLRDMRRSGEIAGALMFNITAGGEMRNAPVYNLP